MKFTIRIWGALSALGGFAAVIALMEPKTPPADPFLWIVCAVFFGSIAMVLCYCIGAAISGAVLKLWSARGNHGIEPRHPPASRQ